VGLNLQDKPDKLVTQAGIEEIDFKEKYVAVKIRFGESGNVFLRRPDFAKTVCDRINWGAFPALRAGNRAFRCRLHGEQQFCEAKLRPANSSEAPMRFLRDFRCNPLRGRRATVLKPAD
jgi:uncharacterized Fe-S center protein